MANSEQRNIPEMEVENAKLKKALEDILNYKEILGLPVIHYRFKKYALLVATLALKGESEATKVLADEINAMVPVIRHPG